jgi:hypothetical protein
VYVNIVFIQIKKNNITTRFREKNTIKILIGEKNYTTTSAHVLRNKKKIRILKY